MAKDMTKGTTKIQADIGRQTVVITLAGTALAVVIAYLAYGYLSSDADKRSQIAPLQTNGRPTPSEESAHYQKVLGHYNQKNADTAQKTGDTYLSVMSTRPVNVPAPAASQAVQINVAASAPPASPAPAPAKPGPSLSDQEHIKNIDLQVNALLANWTGQPHGLARVAKDSKPYAESLSAPKEQATAPQKPAEALQNVILIPGYELIPALLQTHLDTDEASVVEVLVPAGPYAGARVFAPGYKRLENSVDMTFIGMSWKGRTYKINAKAVDETTLRTALSGDVNNRWFTRILLPAVAAGIGRAGQLYERSGAQTVVTPQGGVIQSEPQVPSGQVVAGTVVGGAARQAAQVILKEAQAQPIKQVLVPAQTTIGIRFMEPVMVSDEVRGALNTASLKPVPPPASVVGADAPQAAVSPSALTDDTALDPRPPAPFQALRDDSAYVAQPASPPDDQELQ
jgi:intracellular multiplication protein IcmE